MIAPDPNNPNLQLCFGFKFTMPADYEAPEKPLPPPANLFVGYADQTDTSYFSETVFARGNDKDKDANDVCRYTTLPTQ